MADVLNETDDRRENERLLRTETAKLKVVSSHHNKLVDRRLVGFTQNISADGIGMTITEPLPIASQVEVALKLNGLSGLLYLQGRICYKTKIKGNGHYYHGIAIDDRPIADIQSWRALFDD